jgi:histone H3/H4
LVRNLLNAGIPTVPNRATVPISQQIDMTRLKPEQFASINGLDPNAVRRASLDRRMSTGAAPTQLMPPNASEESGAVPKATWEPDAEYDAKLLARLLEPTKPERSSGRATFGRLGIPRIMENVPMEVVPEALKALLEEKDDPSKAAVDPALPGRNKRRFQELADTVDSELIIEHDVETVRASCSSNLRRNLMIQVLLEIANEHADLVSQLACNLAKHRGSDQVDRKDVQLAYGEYMTFSARMFPDVQNWL